MLKRIAQFIRNHDWFAVIVEVLVVVVGLLLAFQLDGWRETLAEREQERTYIDRLIADVEADLPKIEYAVELQTIRLGFIELLMKAAGDPMIAADDPIVFLAAIDQAAFTYTPTLTTHTFENLRSTGDLRLIQSEDVKNALFSYYDFDESQRQYRSLQLTTEFRHFELVAGVLTEEQALFVQDAAPIITPNELDEVRELETNVDEVVAAARRLEQRQDLVAWLPYVRSLQLEQIAVHSWRIDLANDALDVLRAYAEEIKKD